MTLSKNNLSLLSYLIKSNDLSMREAIEWSFELYSLDEVPSWVYDVTLDTTKTEFLQTLQEVYSVDGGCEFSFEVGSFCNWYLSDGFSLYALIQNLLIMLDKTKYNENELNLLLGAETLFQEDKDAKARVLDLMNDFINTYNTLYVETIELFKKEMQISELK